MADDAPEPKEYVINKIGEDGNPTPDKSSENYTGKAEVQYTNGDTYTGDFKDGVREGEGTYVYGETGNKYEGQWKLNKKKESKITHAKNMHDLKNHNSTSFI